MKGMRYVVGLEKFEKAWNGMSAYLRLRGYVKVVRCKECEHWGKDEKCHNPKAVAFRHRTAAKYYCYEGKCHAAGE